MRFLVATSLLVSGALAACSNPVDPVTSEELPYISDLTVSNNGVTFDIRSAYVDGRNVLGTLEFQGATTLCDFNLTADNTGNGWTQTVASDTTTPACEDKLTKTITFTDLVASCGLTTTAQTPGQYRGSIKVTQVDVVQLPRTQTQRTTETVLNYAINLPTTAVGSTTVTVFSNVSLQSAIVSVKPLLTGNLQLDVYNTIQAPYTAGTPTLVSSGTFIAVVGREIDEAQIGTSNIYGSTDRVTLTVQNTCDVTTVVTYTIPVTCLAAGPNCPLVVPEVVTVTLNIDVNICGNASFTGAANSLSLTVNTFQSSAFDDPKTGFLFGQTVFVEVAASSSLVDPTSVTIDTATAQLTNPGANEEQFTLIALGQGQGATLITESLPRKARFSFVLTEDDYRTNNVELIPVDGQRTLSINVSVTVAYSSLKRTMQLRAGVGSAEKNASTTCTLQAAAASDSADENPIAAAASVSVALVATLAMAVLAALF